MLKALKLDLMTYRYIVNACIFPVLKADVIS